MPAASAWLTGSLKASLSTTASAIPSALAEMAVFMALTISATIESLDPVHWNSQLSSAQASMSAVAAAEALVSPTPPSSRRRVTRLRPSVSTACSTTGSTLDIATLLGSGVTRSVGGEPVDGGRVVLVTGPEHGRGEVGVVGRVRVVLGLEGEAVALAVGPAAGADDGAVEEVAGVELDAGLDGQDLEHPPAPRVLQPGRQLQPGAVPVEHPVVVVAAAELQLLEAVVADALADPGRPGEVHRRAGHRVDGPGGDQGVADRRVVAGLEQQLVVVDVARA